MLDGFDLIIASTALAINPTMVSNNERHVGGIVGLKLVNSCILTYHILL